VFDIDVEQGFKIILVGGILIIISQVIPAIVEAVLVDRLIDPNSSLSIFERGFTAEELKEKGLPEIWVIGLFALIGYYALPLGLVLVVIGGFTFIRKPKTVKK